jgi:hypothetical protein
MTNIDEPSAITTLRGIGSHTPDPNKGLTDHHREGAPVTTAAISLTPTPAQSDADFAQAVRDVLTEHQLNDHQLTGESIESLTEQIVAAYQPRIHHEQTVVARLRQQIHHLFARDKALSHHMEQMHDSHTKTLVSRDRYGVQVRVLTEQVSEISAAVNKAAGAGATMLALGELTAILRTPRQFPPQPRPVPLSFVSNDTRWTSGLFDDPDGVVMLDFIGWAVVARGLQRDSVVEPMFRRNGSQYCQSDLQQFHGLTLNHLL